MTSATSLYSMSPVPHIVVQMGHAGRTTGSTGTHREQEFTTSLGPIVANQLTQRGYHVSLIDAVTGAYDSVPRRADAFISLHGDGSSDPARRGASVGFPDDIHSAEFAWAWKSVHSRSYPGPWHRDNYTSALRGYYMWKRTTHIKYRFLAEHGTLTNRADEKWLFDNLTTCAMAHVVAVSRVLPITTPSPVPLAESEDEMWEYIQHCYKESGRERDTKGQRGWFRVLNGVPPGPERKGHMDYMESQLGLL